MSESPMSLFENIEPGTRNPEPGTRKSFLSTLSPSQIIHEPFPHIVVDKMLPEPLCQQLIREFPRLDVFTKGQPYGDNQKRYYHAIHALAEGHLSPAWKTMVSDFLFQSTWVEAYRLFRSAILTEYPDFEAQYGNPEDFRIGTRFRDDPAACDMLLNSFLLIHTPIHGQACVERGPHYKMFKTLYVGYLFLRPEEDDSEGGDLELFSIKPGAKIQLNQRHTVDRELLQLEKVIPYRANTFVLFLNTSRSIQGVSLRSPTRFPMMHLHFNAYFRKPLFHVKDKPGTVARDFLERNIKRVTRLVSNK